MSEKSVEDLIRQLSDKDGFARKRARHELVLIGEPALPSLFEVLEGSAKRPRWEAAKALAELAAPSTIPALIALLSDPEPDLRWLGAEGLVRVGPRSLPAVLQELIKRPESIDIRRATHHVFRELSHQNLVVEEMLAPVMEVLGDADPASVIPPKAEEAYERLQSFW